MKATLTTEDTIEVIRTMAAGAVTGDGETIMRIKGRKDLVIPKNFWHKNTAMLKQFMRGDNLLQIYREVIKFGQYIEFEEIK